MLLLLFLFFNIYARFGKRAASTSIVGKLQSCRNVGAAFYLMTDRCLSPVGLVAAFLHIHEYFQESVTQENSARSLRLSQPAKLFPNTFHATLQPLPDDI